MVALPIPSAQVIAIFAVVDLRDAPGLFTSMRHVGG